MTTVGSLCSGIGGLDLGLERAGWTVVWQAETDEYASRVLARHWPAVPNLGDITVVDWSSVEHVDLIAAGYPCQPFSHAGARLGERDRRHLWPTIADAVRCLRPDWLLLENVTGHLSLGFGRVLADLAEIGYDADWDCVPAAYVGAPHVRYRIFVVAHVADADRRRQQQPERAVDPLRRRSRDSDPETLADPDGVRSDRRTEPLRPDRWRESANRRRDAGAHWAVEPDVGRMAHGIPARMDRLRVLGAAVVPQVAEYVGRLILEVAA